jgi:hypothetical protein
MRRSQERPFRGGHLAVEASPSTSIRRKALSMRASRLVALCAALGALLTIGAAAASAATVYVSSSSPAVPNGKSCAEPKYNAVQAAIDAGASKINICSGTYTEQLSITKAVSLAAANGAGTATVSLPASATNSATECDTKEGLEQIDEISICTSDTVKITGVNVQALIPLETCAKGLNGIFVGAGGVLKATNLTVNGASSTLNDFKGCQHGVSIEVGSKTPLEIGHAILSKVTSTGYQKNGPTAKGAGSSLSMSSSTVTGEGASPYIAQNGVEVAFGAAGTIKSSSISGNECSIPSTCGATAEQASGVLFFGAANGSKLTSSTVKENDLGVYYASGSATVPPTPDVTLSTDFLTSNRYEGVELEEGRALLKNVTINGSGRVGIELLQSAGQASAIESSATSTKVSGQSEASIKVTSDKLAGDKPGTFAFKGTATAPVLINESSNFTVVF